MKAQFTFISGSRAGQTDIFSQPTIGIGRHPESELKFDTDRDLDVSSRHAVITRAGEEYILRDLDSTNGTFVNGHQLAKEQVLANHDVIRFGPNGPQVVFNVIASGRVSSGSAPATPVAAGTLVYGAQSSASPPSPPANPPPSRRPSSDPAPGPKRPPAPGTTTRVRMEVQRHTRRFRRTTASLVVLLILVSGAYLWQARATGQRLTQQRALLLGQVDSLMQEMATMAAGTEGLRAALDSAQSTASQLRQQLTSAPNDATKINELRRRLDSAMRQQRTLAGAAAMDARGIAAANRDAVALVFVQFPDGQVFTGTAFAVRSDPNGGLLVTNRHVVSDSNGTLASRIGVVFNGTPQNFRADVLKLHPEVDLALLRVTVHRGFPVVKGLADSIRRAEMGDPAAVLGFPLGLDLPGGHDWSQHGAAATLTLGTVSRILPDLIQLDSYGAQGSSGSPILDPTGRVFGVLYGGQSGSNGRILYGVPVRFVHQLLAGTQ